MSDTNSASGKPTLANLRAELRQSGQHEAEILSNYWTGGSLTVAFLLAAAWCVALVFVVRFRLWQSLLIASSMFVLLAFGGGAWFRAKRLPTKVSEKLKMVRPWLIVAFVQAAVAYAISKSRVLSLLLLAAGVLIAMFFIWPRKKALVRLKQQLAQRKRPITDMLAPDISSDLSELPQPLDKTLADAVDGALEDYIHLKGVLGEFPESELVDAAEVANEAELGLRRLCLQVRVTHKLSSIHSDRPDDAQASEAYQAALRRLQQFQRLLHDATSAALRFLATQEQTEAKTLKEQIDRLHAAAEAQQEVNALLA